MNYHGTGKDTRLAVRELMERPPSRELELPPTAGKPARQLLRKLGLEVDSPVPQVGSVLMVGKMIAIGLTNSVADHAGQPLEDCMQI